MAPDQHQLLAETSRGTRMGNLLRRYWTPVLLSSELVADGAPVRVRIMGEDLIGFRTSSGKPGLLREACSHRGASLYYARNGEEGLRCWYHGWKYDVEGNCLDTPNEPATSRIRERIKHPAYPCIDKNGAVWAYLGPKETMPGLPELEFLLVPDSHVFVSKRIQLCHWTQGMDGDLDPGHVPFLHGELLQSVVEHAGHASTQWMIDDRHPRQVTHPLPGGMLYASQRNANADTYYWRIGTWFAPGFTMLAGFAGDGPLTGHSWVPIDDKSCWVFVFTWHPARPLSADERRRMSSGEGTSVYAKLIPGTFTPMHNKSNDYAGPNPPAAKQPYQRVLGFQEQDICITESMGGLYDRTHENLTGVDNIIVVMRRRLMDAALALEKSGDIPAKQASDYRYRPVSLELPRSEEKWWQAAAEAMDPRPETFRASA
jgi:phthalate 4,5-dioxygenase oxygenase subunit